MQNLGNTCYMNSSLQCLSNTYELTRFMLDQRFEFMIDKKEKNPLGTEGRLVMAYAKLINEMWNMDSSVVRPDLFKRILGEYAQQFQGYGQHDSHECINTVLDLMGEDLYRKGKKPYIEQTEIEGQDEEEAAAEAWNKHLLRNESVITDLFHGQFKSTVSCSKCDRVSITFDPMMTMMLPIPAQKQSFKLFYIPYDIKDGYVNYSGEVQMRSTDTITTFREEVEKHFDLPKGSYIITHVSNNEFTRFFSAKLEFSQILSLEGAGLPLLYQTPPALNTAMPAAPHLSDNNNGVDLEWTKLALNIKQFQKLSYSNRLTKDSFLPRMMWVRKDWTMKDLHIKVLQYIKHVIAEWIDWKDPNTTKKPKEGSKVDFRKDLINFPYRPKEWPHDKVFTRADFEAMNEAEQFELCFPALASGKPTTKTPDDSFDLKDQPYKLLFKDVSGYYEDCHYCGESRCGGCAVPFRDDTTINELLGKLAIDANDTLFLENNKLRGKEFQVTFIWH